MFLKEPFKIKYLVGLVICLFGALLMIFNDKHSSTDEKSESNDLARILLGVMFGISHIIFFSLTWVGTKLMVNDKIESNVQLLYVSGSNLVIGLIFVFTLEDITKIFNLGYFILCCIAGSIYYMGLLCIQLSYTNIDLIKLTPISYLRIFFSFIVGYLFIGEVVGYSDLIGSCIILGYNIYNVYDV